MSIKQKSSFREKNEQGTLYLVPTPIGNLQDMTFRALEILEQVDLICAEDTRNTMRLLNHFEIKTPQISFHEHNTQERIPYLIEKLQAGQDLAQVSDAGMPSISDPGHELVKACIQADIAVVPLPGANAALSALIASGIAPQPFMFYGFLPRKKNEQREVLEQLEQQTCALIFYEAPHRLKKTLKAMQAVFGPEREIALCRELTKRYEEFLRGTLADAVEWATNEEIRGEFVLVVQGNSAPRAKKADPLLELPLAEQVTALIAQKQLKPNAAIKEVAKLNGLKKQDVYNEYHQL
ncbi:16S rRNA (cytidine(1402)-2'-O)-methyltransferase [Ligilactobacillus animalis]|uniref:16S rRNA (cytidine(1402)-2'-O)-methyltransferase n=1 Tax=Ligilactobacillus animalis TaxID=1605 RepID=UPI002647AAC2|nr:16S rRNA (cytidine(1402)-2'-O)-methyltransferase [Ligilactobacillus animalis]WKB73234.1 16S rRNA (cytidine(1402)-2'-O)-methyltransferase [Ligilactobacillus animalis]